MYRGACEDVRDELRRAPRAGHAYERARVMLARAEATPHMLARAPGRLAERRGEEARKAYGRAHDLLDEARATCSSRDVDATAMRYVMEMDRADVAEAAWCSPSTIDRACTRVVTAISEALRAEAGATPYAHGRGDSQ